MDPLLLMMIVFGLLFYLLVIRPQNKRMKAHQELIGKLEPGSRIMLTSGIFGTVTTVGERQMVVELAPGVEVAVMKGHVAKVVGPEDEEFEFEDEAPAGAFAADDTVDAPSEHYATDEELEQMFGSSEGDEPVDERRDDDLNR